jgi:hypothetical protein
MPKQKPSVNIEEEQPISLSIIPDNTQPAPRFYSNFCVVRHTPFDFNIEFCELAALHEDEQKKLTKTGSAKTLRAPVRAEIVLSSEIIPAFIDALQSNYQKFLEHYKK